MIKIKEMSKEDYTKVIKKGIKKIIIYMFFTFFLLTISIIVIPSFSDISVILINSIIIGFIIYMYVQFTLATMKRLKRKNEKLIKAFKIFIPIYNLFFVIDLMTKD